MRLGALLLLLSAAAADDATPLLVEALRDSDRGVRYAAAQALGKAGRAPDALAAALEDPEWCVRQAAGRALAACGDAALPVLERLLVAESPDLRVAAVAALRRLHSPLVARALDDPDPRVVLEALDAGAGLPVPRLLELLDSPDPETRLMAARALAPEAPEPARKALLDIMLGSEEESRLARWAKGLLEDMEPQAVEDEPEWEISDLESQEPADRECVLRGLGGRGAELRDRAEELAELLRVRRPEVVRAAAVAMELVGADPRPLLLDRPRVLPFVAPPGIDLLPALLERLPGVRPRDRPALALSIGRIGPEARAAAPALKGLLADADPRTRGAAAWALGRIGEEAPEALSDDDPVVREVASATVRSVPALREVLARGGREARVLAARRLAEVAPAEAAPLVRDPDPLVRVAAARGHGAELADDPERDVRIAAAHGAAERLLADGSWRVQLAALRARPPAAAVAPFLGHRNPALSFAAADALMAAGGDAALPVAEALACGNEAVRHHAPHVFEAIGAAGAPAVPRLAPLLRHANVNVREAAARCLAAIGPGAAGASAALVEALGDRRLCVVANAALALGRIGVTDALLAGLRDGRARVRAYSAFAVGWALGARRGVDQVAYEPRLPVLECREPGPVPAADDVRALDALAPADRARLCLRGLRSSDPRVAIPCAARLEFDRMDAWECERAVELLAPEGFRPGEAADFDRFRAYVASTELPACLEYSMYPRVTVPERRDLHGDYHRAPRAENVPAICRLFRTEDWIRREGLDELLQPFWRTTRHRKEILRHLGRETVWEWIAGGARLYWAPFWWFEEEPMPPGAGPLLVRVAQESLGGSEAWQAFQAWSALRLLGRLSDEGTAQYLRRVIADEDDVARDVAIAALARRGDPEAMALLVRRSAEDEQAMGLLLDAAPGLANAVLRARLSDPRRAAECAGLVGRALDHATYYVGARVDPACFLGIEPSLDVQALGAEALDAVARLVPGCRTRRLATAIFDRIGDGPLPQGAVELLFAADPARCKALLRARAGGAGGFERDFSIAYLIAIGDPADDALVADWYLGHEDSDLPVWRSPRVERALLERGDADDLLRYQLGFELLGASEEDEDALRRAALRGRAVEAAVVLLARHLDVFWSYEDPPGHPWMKVELERRRDAREHGRLDQVLGQLAVWPDAGAREEYWSILRAGRYRWVDRWQDSHAITLGHDFATLPHWADELESNCCRIAGRVEHIFEDLFGIGVLYSCHESGVGEPPSRRVREWFGLRGGEMVWSPVARRFVARPE